MYIMTLLISIARKYYYIYSNKSKFCDVDACTCAYVGFKEEDNNANLGTFYNAENTVLMLFLLHSVEEYVPLLYLI